MNKYLGCMMLLLILITNPYGAFSCDGRWCNVLIKEYHAECECVYGQGCSDNEVLIYEYYMCGPSNESTECRNLYYGNCGKKWPCLTDWKASYLYLKALSLGLCVFSCFECSIGILTSCVDCASCLVDASDDDWCEFIERCYPDVNSVIVLDGYCTCVSG